MNTNRVRTAVNIVAALSVATILAFASQDRFTQKSPNGITFSEFRGYETWQTVAVSQMEDGIKAILGNPAMIKAYQGGTPGKGKLFPDGSMIVKIEWAKKKSTESPYAVEVPDTLRSVSFIEKDSKRFPETAGWGYAQFKYDAPPGAFKSVSGDKSFGKRECFQCYTIVKAKDYIFTAYPLR